MTALAPDTAARVGRGRCNDARGGQCLLWPARSQGRARSVARLRPAMSSVNRWLVLVAGLATACASPAPGVAPHVASVTSASAVPLQLRMRAASADPASTPPDAAAEATVARALRFVSRLRELDATAPVKGRVITRDEMVSRVEHSLDTEIPPAVVTASGEILFALGTVPASFDYRPRSAASDALGAARLLRAPRKDHVPRRRRPGQELDATLWHELVHACKVNTTAWKSCSIFATTQATGKAPCTPGGGRRNQRHDRRVVRRKARSRPGFARVRNGPAERAVRGLVQGVPPIIKRSVVAPYLDGLSFVNALRRRGGWSAVAAACSACPPAPSRSCTWTNTMRQRHLSLCPRSL